MSPEKRNSRFAGAAHDKSNDVSEYIVLLVLDAFFSRPYGGTAVLPYGRAAVRPKSTKYSE